MNKTRGCKFALEYPWLMPSIRFVRIFEACFADPKMLAGELGTVEMRPLIPDVGAHANKLLLVGENIKRLERIKTGMDLFEKIEAGCPKSSLYYKLMKADIRNPRSRRILRKARKAHQMYIRAKRGDWRPEPYPMAVDYFGYQHNRDGTHRRMVLYALGKREYPTRILRFEDLVESDFTDAHPYIKETWQRFRHCILGV